VVSKRRPLFPVIPAGRELWIAKRQVKAHLRIVWPLIFGHLLNLIALVAVNFGTVPTAALMGWAVAVMAVLAHRASVWHSRRNQPCTPRDAIVLEINTFFLALVMTTGLAMLYAYGTFEHRVFLAIAATSMIGAAGMTMRTLPRAALCYIGLITISMAGSLAWEGQPELIGAAGMLITYALMTARTSLTAYNDYVVRTMHERDLATTNETVRLLLNDYEDQGASWLFETDVDGLLLPVSDRLADAVDLPAATLYRLPLTSLFKTGPERDALSFGLKDKDGFRALTVSLMVGKEERFWSISGRPSSLSDGSGTGLRGVITDVTAEKLAVARVAQLALYDSLTGLPNRHLFSRSLTAVFGDEANQIQSALLLVDVDHFKLINDAYGHKAGDAFLKKVAQRLQETLSLSDYAGEGCSISRLGGDEFAVLMSGVDIEDHSRELASEIVTAMAREFILDGKSVQTSVSIGLAMAPIHAINGQDLQRSAEMARRYMKRTGGSNFAVFATDMDSDAQARMEMERDLRSALTNNELQVYFQPLVEAESGNHSGFEALVRWVHPERGMVMPDQFIPLAEETGLIVPIGEWVLRSALAEAASWRDPLSVAVNLSPVQMRNPGLLGMVVNALAETGVEPSRLELEITESVLLNDSEANLNTLHLLRKLGVRIALDDFGTGYSSLNYLRTFPFDKIKIDRCFIKELEEREDCRAIVSAVIGLARNLGMVTTAEGVEHEYQLEQLRREGCTQLQGYLFGKPEPAESYEGLRADVEPVIVVEPVITPIALKRARA
jgi:diguanylate cyclase (GGDEF)-like protein